MSSVVASLLYSLWFMVRSRASLHLEIIALRHQLAVVQSVPPPTSPRHVGRPDVVGVALAGMARLAFGRSHRQAGNRHRVAPARLSSVLDVEEPTPHRPPDRSTRRSRPDPRTVHLEPALGCASDSRGTSEVGDLSESVDRRQVHATTSAPRNVSFVGRAVEFALASHHAARA